jgi:hypothetical protein
LNTDTKEFLKAGRMGNLFAHAVAKITSVLSVSSVAAYSLILCRALRELRGKFLPSFLTSNKKPVSSIQFLHIERGAHGVLNKNKNYAKFFISHLYKHLSQKTSCGRGTIFARGAHVRAKGRESVFLLSWVARP